MTLQNTVFGVESENTSGDALNVGLRNNAALHIEGKMLLPNIGAWIEEANQSGIVCGKDRAEIAAFVTVAKETR